MVNVFAYDLYQFACTTGELYKRQCALANRSASIEEWQLHCLGYVIPLYRLQVARKPVKIDRSELRQASQELRDYYGAHIKE